MNFIDLRPSKLQLEIPKHKKALLVSKNRNRRAFGESKFNLTV